MAAASETCATMAQLHELQARSAAEGKLLSLFFWAEYHSAAAPGGQLDILFTELAKSFPDVICAKVDAETVEDVSDHFEIEAVPHWIFLSGDSVLESLSTSNAKEVAAKMQANKAKVAPAAAAPSSSSAAARVEASRAADPPSLAADPALRARLHELTSAAHVVLFIKGTPEAPRCKFSRAAVARLAEAGVRYTSFDILADEAVRAGLKEFGGQGTYPQLWVGGKLLGGGDVITTMAEDGTLASTLAPKTVDVTAPGKPPAHVRCEALVKQAPVMLFMKGTPDAPRCGFSARTVELLQGQSIQFGSFDILTDPEVRQGLKECCGKWPTFPQLFVKGQFVGGLDILKEMVEEGDEPLAEQFGLE